MLNFGVLLVLMLFTVLIFGAFILYRTTNKCTGLIIDDSLFRKIWLNNILRFKMDLFEIGPFWTFFVFFLLAIIWFLIAVDSGDWINWWLVIVNLIIVLFLAFLTSMEHLLERDQNN